jgi:DNA-binding LacI/PurR family transcriptional regulator
VPTAPSANRGDGDILGLQTVDRALTMSGRVNARDTVARETRLSSVSNACPEAGRISVSLLMDILKTRVVRDVRYVLGTSLVIRKTTGTAATS